MPPVRAVPPRPSLPAAPAPAGPRPRQARRRRLQGLVAVLATGSLLALAGCGGGSDDTVSSGPTSAGGSTTASSGPLPTVAGSYGAKPTLTFPDAKPSTALQVKVLSEGSGPAVAKGDLLVADYLGQVWNGKVFDNSYDRGQPAGFQIGTGKVIAGWDEGLVGVKGGSRVLLVIPPAKGYGEQGNSQAGIKGTDTLAFVVDVVQSFGKTAGGDPKAMPQKASTGPVKITGAPGERPTVTVAKGAKLPTKTSAVLLAKGSGPVVKPGLLVVQYEAVTWAGKPAGSTWTDGVPVAAPVGGGGQGGSPFDALVGMPVGSRALITLAQPKSASAPASGVAAVVDIVAEPQPAKDAAEK